MSAFLRAAAGTEPRSPLELAKAVVFSPAAVVYVAPLLWLADAVLSAAIIWRVPCRCH